MNCDMPLRDYTVYNFCAVLVSESVDFFCTVWTGISAQIWRVKCDFHTTVCSCRWYRLQQYLCLKSVEMHKMTQIAFILFPAFALSSSALEVIVI
jgi:hypothetical protein